jgi:hypothetical protein
VATIFKQECFALFDVDKTLTPSPSPKMGEGNQKIVLLPLSLNGRGGWG